MGIDYHSHKVKPLPPVTRLQSGLQRLQEVRAAEEHKPEGRTLTTAQEIAYLKTQLGMFRNNATERERLIGRIAELQAKSEESVS